MNSVMALLTQSSPSKTSLSPSNGGQAGEFQRLLSNLASTGKGEEDGITLSPKKVEQLLEKVKSILKGLEAELDGINLKELLTNGEEGITVNQLFRELEDNLLSDDLSVQMEGLNSLSVIVSDLSDAGIDNSKLKQVENHVAELMTRFAAVISQTTSQKNSPAIMVDTKVMRMNSSQQVNLHADQQQAQRQLHTLWQKFKELTGSVGQTDNKEAIELKTALAIKQVMQDISKVLKAHPVQGKEWMAQLTKQGSEFQQQLFKNLAQPFLNRQNLPSSYHQQVPVKAKDIAKWISQFVEQESSHQKNSVSQTGYAPSQTTMSKVEQFVVHVNQNQSQAAKQQQFIQELERVFQSSKMFANRAGGMEMQLKLKPANMGDMLIRMVQMNGEMAVKILVSSQAAKDMLDGNMNQLRHMFSPQQVIVEKQENMQAQQTFFQDANMKEDNQGNQREQGNADEQHSLEEENEEEWTFKEILMNEKV
ncbi:flagellar hook-length control protein FliK [Halobacillus salinus]|uniref:flagellar hook-length control protein FliK n=1 Tax=Halobacillus salinus TaxID=192814 RepID=UPI0009A8D6D1|nr:flagellar hook-length control protein FliK [Halobacillus salinus]